MSYVKATAPEARLPPIQPFSARLRAVIRPTWQICQALVIIGLIAWFFGRGIRAMDYHWQWYRVQPFFYKVTDGSLILGPLVRGLIETLQITCISAVFTIIIGFVTAFLRLSDSIAGRMIATCYLEAIRNTPLLVQLFLFYFVLAPILGIDRFWTGVICLSFFEGSFASEIIRAGIQGVDKGQFEAADAIGFTARDKYRYIVVPQSLPLILPPLTGLTISLVKHSAILSVIAISELTTEGLNLISNTFMAFEIWFLVAGIYLVLTVGLSFAVGLVEARLRRQG